MHFADYDSRLAIAETRITLVQHGIEKSGTTLEKPHNVYSGKRRK